MQDRGLTRADVDHVYIAHIYFEAIGYPHAFTNATINSGADIRSDRTSQATQMIPTCSSTATSLRGDRVPYIAPDDPGTESIGPFAKAHDYYGDGSVYVVHTPGHLPGHLALLARTSPGGARVVVASDALRDWRLVTGEANIADGPHFGCVRRGKEAANGTLARMIPLTQELRSSTMSHDAPWCGKNQGRSLQVG